ncbi:MAG: calycin-like domain-containing protein [Bacteroidales bacterium]|nr:calycin-like domain-containing protein [Bacteroidales bacterium]
MNVRRIMFCLLLVPGLIIGVSSCKDDDDDDTDYAQIIEGTYKGTLKLNGNTLPSKVKIKVEHDNVNKVILRMDPTTLPISAEVSVNIPEIVCVSTVSSKDEKYYTTGSTTVTLEAMPGVEIPVSVSGTFDKNNNVEILIGLTISGSPVNVAFTGVLFNGVDSYAEEIAGTYTGILEIEEQTVAQNVKIAVEEISDTKVNLKMNQTVMELPINITKCESEVLYANDKYTINAGTTVTLPKEAVEGLLGMEIPMPGTTLDVPITVKGEFNKSNEAQINIGLVNFMDQSVFLNVVFKGKKYLISHIFIKNRFKSV